MELIEERLKKAKKEEKIFQINSITDKKKK